MELVTTFIGAVLYGLLVIFVAIVTFFFFAFPTALNIAVSAYTSIKITKRWYLVFLIVASISALLSFNVRIPNLIFDASNPDFWPSQEITRKLLIAPDEKISLKLDEPAIYYRQNTAVSHWWPLSEGSANVKPLPMIVERPKDILRRLKFPSTVDEASRVSLTINTTHADGLVIIHAELKDQEGLAASYHHVARRNFNFENLNSRGVNKEPWRAYFSIFTQKTPWNWSRDYYPPRFSPIEDFLKKAVSFQAVDAFHAQTDSDGVPARVPTKPQLATISAPPVALPLDEVPEYRQKCQGISKNQPFQAYASVGQIIIFWEDQDFYPMILGGSVDGYQGSLNVTACSGSEIKVTSVHSGEINIWHYQVDFMTRSLIPSALVNLAVPAELLDEKLRYRAYLKWIDRGTYGIILASHKKKRRANSNPEPVGAHLLELMISESG